MNITIACVGKVKENYLKKGIEDYLKRLSTYARVQIQEVPDEKAPDSLSTAEMTRIQTIEGRRLLHKIPSDAYTIALAINGQSMSSETFASRLDKLMTYGQSKITFIIGGSLGLSADVLHKADLQLSFSKMTFPHQLMRLILLEQIYRAYRINRGEPYHK